MMEFEKHEKLKDFIQEMASFGSAPKEWSTFIHVLNEALQFNAKDYIHINEHEEKMLMIYSGITNNRHATVESMNKVIEILSKKH